MNLGGSNDQHTDRKWVTELFCERVLLNGVDTMATETT
jgi:hypothetical protein